MNTQKIIMAVNILLVIIIACLIKFNYPDEKSTEAATIEFKEPEDVTVNQSLAASVEETTGLDKLWDVPLDAELQHYIKNICRNSPIEPEIIIAICEAESGYDAHSVGDSGYSLGLMQIKPECHYKRMERLNCSDLFNPYDNVTVGLDIIQELYMYYDGKIEMALMAYNGGYEYAESQLWVSEYALKIINRAKELKENRKDKSE